MVTVLWGPSGGAGPSVSSIWSSNSNLDCRFKEFWVCCRNYWLRRLAALKAGTDPRVGQFENSKNFQYNVENIGRDALWPCGASGPAARSLWSTNLKSHAKKSVQKKLPPPGTELTLTAWETIVLSTTLCWLLHNIRLNRYTKKVRNVLKPYFIIIGEICETNFRHTRIHS
jgi:hypothetical protein